MSNCIFCKIVQGEIPSAKIYEDEKIFVFKDINPEAPTHILLIPKKHIVSLMDLDDFEIISHIHKVAQKMAKELGISESGFRLVNNCKEDGGQTVDHLHYHMLGGRKLQWPPG